MLATVLRKVASTILPLSSRNHLREIGLSTVLTGYEREVVSRLRNGFMPRECPLCDFKGGFLGMGIHPRYDAVCPECGSLERHRLLALYLERNPSIIQPDTTVLHFAPEKPITVLIKSKTRNYTSADLMPGRADRALNIECLELPDGSIDLIVCSHVLQHVDDRRALSEIFRVLRPSGVALLIVPINGRMRKTYEIGQAGPDDMGDVHLRFYGLDVIGLVEAAGFVLEEFFAVDPDIDRFGLMRGDSILVARRPS